MALLHVNFHSEILGLACSMAVILPQRTTRQIGLAGAVRGRSAQRGHPVLYLLHGLSDDHTIWQRRTSIERYVAPLGLAVVMPAVGRSFYADTAYGQRYWTFLSEELPALCRQFFPVSARRQDTFVAGLSMGGYGAFKLALRHPDRFAATASLSGALDRFSPARRYEPAMRREMEAVFGDLRQARRSDQDLFHLARRLARATGPKPRFYQCCGTDDFLYEDNTRFRDHAARLGLDLTYEEGPGSHEWGYWDRMIQRVLAWLVTKA